jgi:hypothetical protein
VAGCAAGRVAGWAAGQAVGQADRLLEESKLRLTQPSLAGTGVELGNKMFGSKILHSMVIYSHSKCNRGIMQNCI